MRIGVTGCTSQIGESVCKSVLTHGFELFRIGRREEIVWNLGEEIPKLKLDCLIHLAHDRNLKEKDFTAATESIIHSVRSETFLVNISSTSSHSKAISNYGKNKFIAENLIVDSGGAVFKSGLIFRDGGSSHTGVLGTIVSVIDKFSVIPLPYRGKSQFYFTEVETLSKLLVESAILKSAGVFRAFNPSELTFNELIETIASQLGVSRRVIPIPDNATKVMLQIARLTREKGILDSLLSLSSEISDAELKTLLEPNLDFPKFRFKRFHHPQA
jgi:hypothetical protein